MSAFGTKQTSSSRWSRPLLEAKDVLISERSSEAQLSWCILQLGQTRAAGLRRSFARPANYRAYFCLRLAAEPAFATWF